MKRLLPLLLALACAKTSPPPAIHQAHAPWIDEVAGITTCHTVPRGWVRADLVATWPIWAVAGIVAHELDHTRVASGFGSCEEYKEWLKQPANRLALEVSAHCAQSMAATQYGGFEGLAHAVKTYSANLTSPIYGFGITQAQAESLVRLACKLDSGP